MMIWTHPCGNETDNNSDWQDSSSSELTDDADSDYLDQPARKEWVVWQ